MFGGKKQKKKNKAARSQSCLEHNPAPTLPPRPPGGLPPRSSISFDSPSSFTSSATLPRFLPQDSGVPMESPDIPPPVPTTPRPKLVRPPISIPDDKPPPLPPPLSAPAHSASRQNSAPATPSNRAPPPPPSSNSRYIRSGRKKSPPTATPVIPSGTLLSEEQLRTQIELQTQNTEELRKLLEGKEEEAMTPAILVSRYGKYFPFKASVMKGFYNNRAEIVAGEIYNIHFLKNAKVISIFDSSGEKYVLPLNAAMRIGFEQPNQPPTYYNIIDIINASDPPKLISPCNNYHGSEGNSLKMNEVLQVKGVHVARVRRAKSLLVVNIKTEEEKKIPSDCPISFSTEPTSNQLTLSELVNKVPEMIPGKARLYPTVDVEDMGFPGHLVSETVRVKRHYQERSLIATLEEQEPRPLDRFSLSIEPEMPAKTIYDIPLSLDIEFSVIPPEPEEDIYAYTHQLSRQFDPRKLQSGDGMGLNMAIDEDNIYSGVELELPPYINYDPTLPNIVPPTAASGPPPPLPARRPSTQASADSDGDEYTEIDSNTFTPPPLSSSFPPPLPTSSSFPPPLPASRPPTSRPSSASAKPPAFPRLSPPLPRSPPVTSPKPGKKSQPQATPTGSHVTTPTSPNKATPTPSGPRTGAVLTKDTSIDDYVDMSEEMRMASEENPDTTHPPPTSAAPLPPSYPPPTSAAPLPPSYPPPTSAVPLPPSYPPPTSAAPLPPVMLAVERGREGSPASSTGSAYEDTADLAAESRPRLPSPVTVSESTEDDQEILQQFSDLHRVVKSARSIAKTRQQLSSPSHGTTATELKRLKEDLKRVGPLPQKIINHLMVLEREVSTLSDIVRDELVKTSSSEALQENRQFLATLSVAQVIKMLEMLNMRQYQDKFAQDGIDGDVLCDIEESVLETNLGITRKLDRIKLMKIIRGERSAKSVLEGQYNYVSLQPMS